LRRRRIVLNKISYIYIGIKFIGAAHTHFLYITHGGRHFFVVAAAQADCLFFIMGGCQNFIGAAVKTFL